jgi:hypothetical protein
MTTSTIAAGLKGTLSPKEYTSRPMPHWAEAYDPLHGRYRDIDYVSVAFATDAEMAAALLPNELELLSLPALPGQSVANLVFAKYRHCDLGPYMEVIVTIPVVHRGQVYGYVPAIYVDNDAALIAGRELGGYPKKLAQITVRNYGNLFLSHMARDPKHGLNTDSSFSDVASSNVTKGGKLFSVPLPADKTIQLSPPYDQLLPLPRPSGQPQEYVLRTMALRRVNGIGPGPDGAAGAEALQLVATDWRVTNAEFYAGDAASIELRSSGADPIGRLLPVNSVLGAYILRGDMLTNPVDWTLVEDLKEKK